MSTYFSIGEIAKMFNISTQTLRLYDRLDLLKPAYINNETGYRYYSADQFIQLDCIKLCKTMGLSLEEIKELIVSDSSLESIMDIIRKQKMTLKKRINELEHMNSNLESFENRIQKSIEIGFNKIILVKNKERACIRYKYISKTQEEFEMNLRRVILDAEEKYGTLSSDIGFTISYDYILKNDSVLFKELLIILYDEKKIHDKNVSLLPSGTYLTMYLDESSFDNREYYRKMRKFAEDNEIEIIGDFIETEIIARVNKDGKGNNLAKIELLCK